MPSPPRAVLLALAVCLTGALAGCGGSATTTQTIVLPSPQDQPYPPKAAEPPPAPPVKGTPPGKVVKVGPEAEGMDVDPVTHRVAVAVQSPPRLQILDGASGKLLKSVPLPGTARHVDLAKPGGPFLVPVETADMLLEVSVDGRVLSATKVGDAPHDATWLDGAAYTADEFGSTTSEVKDGKLVRQVPVAAQPGGIVAVGNQIAVSSVRSYTIELFGESDLRGLGAQSAGLGPSHVKADPDGRLYIADTRGQQLIVYTTKPRLKFLARVPLGGAPLGLAVDPARGVIWVSLAQRNQVVALSLADTPKLLDRVATVRQPDTAAVDTANGRVFIASRSDGTLELLPPGIR